LREQVLQYARATFRRVVGHDKADEEVGLAFACMLIALEEEAAYEVELKRIHQQGGGELAFLASLAADPDYMPGSLEEEVSVHFTNRCRSTARTASCIALPFPAQSDHSFWYEC
jgi:hypothetical protein